MEKPMQTNASRPGIRELKTKFSSDPLDLPTLFSEGDEVEVEVEVQAACRMEDEGGPPLPDEGRRPRAVAVRSQRNVRRLPLRRPHGVPTVGDVMTRAVRTVRRDSSIKDVAIALTGDVTGLVPVVDASERLLGVITDRDIVLRACAGDKSIEDMRAGDAMTAAPRTIGAEQSLRDVVATMTRLQLQWLPVVDIDSRLVGVISLSDVASRADSGIDLRAVLAAVGSRKVFWSRSWRR